MTSCFHAIGSVAQSNKTLHLEEFASWWYHLDIRQLQCLVEFVRMWHRRYSLLSTIAFCLCCLFVSVKITCILSFVTKFSLLFSVFCFFLFAVKSIRYFLSKRVLLMRIFLYYCADVSNSSMRSDTAPRVCTMAF